MNQPDPAPDDDDQDITYGLVLPFDSDDPEREPNRKIKENQ